MSWSWCSDIPSGITKDDFSQGHNYYRITQYSQQPFSCWFIPNSDTLGSQPLDVSPRSLTTRLLLCFTQSMLPQIIIYIYKLKRWLLTTKC